MFVKITKVTTKNTEIVAAAMRHLQASCDWMHIVRINNTPCDQRIDEDGETENWELSIFVDRKTGDAIAIPSYYDGEGADFQTIKGVTVTLDDDTLVSI